jgi:selT/selW/selH-like putative selenoprotein
MPEAADLSIELIEGDRGVFDVRADGNLIFSKKTVGRFPSPADILQRL